MARNAGGLARALDRVLFLKNGYSLWMHAVPFGVAALLLLTFSLADDDPLRRLAAVLSAPGWLWIPAILLTAVSAAVYLLTIRYQVRRAYLWPERVLLRTITTAALYLALAFGATPRNTFLELTDVELRIQYGFWRLTTPRENVAGADGHHEGLLGWETLGPDAMLAILDGRSLGVESVTTRRDSAAYAAA